MAGVVGGVEAVAMGVGDPVVVAAQLLGHGLRGALGFVSVFR
jgi:hypothetical protein